MIETCEAIYDGVSLRLDKPLAITPNTRVRVIVETDFAQPEDYVDPVLLAGYRRMAADKEREAEALEWSEATIGDVADEAR